MTHPSVAIIGAGPGGLTAAYELVRRGLAPVVLERADRPGGIARTETYKDYLFDIGGHCFCTKVYRVRDIWRAILGEQFITVPRLSRIYYRGKFYDYPLSIPNVVGNLGAVESMRIFGSYCRAKLRPIRDEQTFEQWVTNRFGDRVYRTFFKTYTEKVWGIPCSEIRADWAAQRIKGLSLSKAVINALFKVNRSNNSTLIHQFEYPRLGPGQMWERCTDIVRAGGATVQFETSVTQVHHADGRVSHLEVRQGGQTRRIEAEHFITSMPLSALVRMMHPAPPQAVLDAAAGLNYRDFLIVTLIADREKLFPDNWIYIHAPEVRVGRIQNFKNWSKDMVPDLSKTSLGMEYFCNEDDDLWAMDDASLIALATKEIDQLGLAPASCISDGCVIRQRKAYPVYDGTYRMHLETIRKWLAGFENLQTIGRNGMHRYNNQDHSMLCGLQAAENVLGADHDLWEVNTERSYYEEHQVGDKARQNGSGMKRAS